MSSIHVPNALSLLRIPLSLLLLVSRHHPVLFWCLYIASGLSDVLDGYMARKLKMESAQGAQLDSLADLVFYLVWIGIFGRAYFMTLVSAQKGLLLAVFFIRILGLFWMKRRFRRFILHHTLANKAVGIGTFLLPFFFFRIKDGVLLWFLLGLSLWAALEEIALGIQSKDQQQNRRSILFP